MPNYDYVCPVCKQTLSVVRSIHDEDPGYECANCKMPMNQFLGGVSLSFKGNGWAHKE